MPDLLDQKCLISNRFVGFKKHARKQTAVTVLPNATEPKALFAVTHRQSSRDNLTMNLSRAVIQNPWQPSRHAWQEAFALSDECIEFVLIFVGRRDDVDDVRRITRTFLDNANRLDQRGQTDAALDIIFDQIDEMLLAGKFNRVDQLLAETTPSDFSVELLLGILTVTLPAKNRLPNRIGFVGQVRQTLGDRGVVDDGLLVGLG